MKLTLLSFSVGRAALAIGCAFAVGGILTRETIAADPPQVEQDGTIHVPAFLLPYSSFLGEGTRTALREHRLAIDWEIATKACPPINGAEQLAIPAIRKCQAEAFYKTIFYKRVRDRYDVTVTPQQIGAVYTEVFAPAHGVGQHNRDRVLVNLHGGGFSDGALMFSHLESIPIASVGKVKVVSIDYRMAPGYRFPAAVEDVVAVYRELLKTYEPQNIGIYGCSSGGILTAETVAWLLRDGLPLPGAVGMFCAGGSYYAEGDAGPFVAALGGYSLAKLSNPQEHPYFVDTVASDPWAFPVRWEHLIARFPPSLLITSTRDQSMSSVVYMHSRLVAQGVDAELHVWEGLEHGFFYDPSLPQSSEVYDVTVKFFDRHLGKRSATTQTPLFAFLEPLLGTEVDQFVDADRVNPPALCQVLFVGSSSIVQWKSLANDVAPLRVINRGFGGSHIEHVNRWFDRIVAPYRPSAIVFYAGENDVDAGKSVDRVIADFDIFMTKKTAALGGTPVYFISLKPSKLRFWQLGVQRQVNDAIRLRATQRSDLHYIDITAPMLQEGKPKDIFLADNLHMKPEGYSIWTAAVRAALLPNSEGDLQMCNRTRQH